MTLCVAIATGVVTGFILKCKCFKGPEQPEEYYNDAFHFAGLEIDTYRRVKKEDRSSVTMVQYESRAEKPEFVEKAE